MKNLFLTTALVTGFAFPALAQDAAVSPFQAEAAGPAVPASDVIGARIYVSEAAVDADAYNGVQEGWDDIGEVNDIILGRDGTVDAVLVDIGGFLGMGERQVAVDMAALRFVQDDATDVDDWFLVMQADRASLDAAPQWVMPGVDGAAATTDGTAPVAEQAATDGAVVDGAVVDGSVSTETAADATAEAATDATAGAMPAAGAMALPEGYTEVDRTTLTADVLTGANVHNAENESIAEVSDLVLTAEGQVTDVILDVGGFLGIGQRSVAIPMDRLTVGQGTGGDVAVWVNMTKEELEALPEYAM